jgi:hypothetical protein
VEPEVQLRQEREEMLEPEVALEQEREGEPEVEVEVEVVVADLKVDLDLRTGVDVIRLRILTRLSSTSACGTSSARL